MTIDSLSTFVDAVYTFFGYTQDSDEQLVLNKVAKCSLSFDKLVVEKKLAEIKATWIQKRFEAKKYAFIEKKNVTIDDLPELFRVSEMFQNYEKKCLTLQQETPKMFSAKVVDIAKSAPDIRFANSLALSNYVRAAKDVDRLFQKISALQGTKEFDSAAQEFADAYAHFIFAMKREMEDFVFSSIDLTPLVFNEKRVANMTGVFQLQKKEKLSPEEKLEIEGKRREYEVFQKKGLEVDYKTTLDLIKLVKEDVNAGKIVDIKWQDLKEVQPKKLLALVLLKALTTSKDLKQIPQMEAFWNRLDAEQLAYLHKTLYQFQPIHFKVIQFMLIQGGAKHLSDGQIRYLHYISPAWAIRVEWFVDEIVEIAKQVAIDEQHLAAFLYKNH